MKALKLLTVLTILSYSTFSQDLTPTVQQVGSDTLFCFQVPQAREIAKRIESLPYRDSVNTHLQNENTKLIEVVTLQRNTIEKLDEKVLNASKVNANNDKRFKLLNETIKSQSKQLKSQGIKIKFLTIGLGAVTTIALLKQ